MKKTIRILSAVMVIAMLALALVSCSKVICGKYSNELTFTTYEFQFNKVIKTTEIGGFTKTTEGTYKIVDSEENEGELIIKFTFGDETESHSFAQGEENGVKYIKIGLFQYNEVK